jgi:hypothetical protein
MLTLGGESDRHGQRLGLGSTLSKSWRKGITVLHTALDDLARDVLRDLGRLGQGSPFGDQSGHVGTGCEVSSAGEGLDIEANEGLLDVLPDPAASRSR